MEGALAVASRILLISIIVVSIVQCVMNLSLISCRCLDAAMLPVMSV